MINKKDIFIVLSVIDHTSLKLSYTSTRSIYGTEERIIQTKKTIESVRIYTKNSKIFLVEIGKKEYIKEFTDLVDTYLFLGNNFLIRLCTDSKYKGLGEAVAMLFVFYKIQKEQVSLIFKLSGRYFLNKNFNQSFFSKNSPTFKTLSKSLSTRLYSFPKHKTLLMSIINILIIPALLSGVSIERLYCLTIKIFRIKTHQIKLLGVSGTIAVNGEVIDE